MNTRNVFRLACLVGMVSLGRGQVSAEEFTNAIRAFLQSGAAETLNVGFVVGLVDEAGSRIVSYGKTDSGGGQEVNGDTWFEIGSVTKTFTALLLQEMVERGEMKLDDPVAKYLPRPVRVPARNGKEITLLQLATHTSGLPRIPDNLDAKRADNPYACYTVEKLYDFLSRYQLAWDPGEKGEYSNLGMGLLGHAIALKAGTDYESLVIERICRPLQMDSTRITPTPKLRSRFATGHNEFGEPVCHWDLPVLPGAGALRSTASDLLKFVSANLGLTPSSSLTAALGKMVQLEGTNGPGITLTWAVTPSARGTRIVWHNGGTGGHRAFLGFDKQERRGVVVLSNSKGIIDLHQLGMFLFESEWRPDRRPREIKRVRPAHDSYVGQYQPSAGFGSRLLRMRQSLLQAPKAAVYIPAGFCLAMVLVIVWRAGSLRKRCLVLGCAVPAGGLVVWLLNSSGAPAGPASQAGIGIHREGDRLFAQVTGARSWPVDALLPPNRGELLPESQDRFFDRLSGKPVVFFRDARGRVSGLTVQDCGKTFAYERTSEKAPAPPERRKPRVAIQLDTNILEACVGRYEFAPEVLPPSGIRVTIWREGTQLFWLESGQNAAPGAIDLYPTSTTNFFLKVTGAELTFLKNEKGEVRAVRHHLAGYPDAEGKRLTALNP